MKLKHGIYKRKDGLYEGRITINNERKSVYGRSKAEVHRKLVIVVQTAEEEKFVTKTRPLKAELAEWLIEIKRPTVKYITYDRAESIFLNHIANKQVAKKSYSTISVEELQKLINDICDKGYSYSTTKKVRDLLGEFYKYKFATLKIDFNPMQFVRMPSRDHFPEKKKMQVLSVDELKRIQECASEKNDDGTPVYRYAEAIVLMIHTGLRSSELRGIKLSDIDFDTRTLTIRRAITYYKDREKGGVRYSDKGVKTFSSKRSIPLSNRAIESINILKATTYNPKTDYLICTENGKWLTHQHLLNALNRLLKKAGISGVSGTHCLRHSFATILLKDAEKQGSIKEVSELLGHSRTNTTYEFYITSRNEDKIFLLSQLDEML